MASLDLTLLRLLRTRDRYDLYHRSIPKEILEPHTRILLDDYGKWYAESDGAPITAEGFLPWFLLAHPKLKDEPKSMLTSIIKNAQASVPEDVERGILVRLEDARQAQALTSMLERYNAGEEVSIMRTVQQLAESVRWIGLTCPKPSSTSTVCLTMNRTTGDSAGRKTH